MALIYGHKLSLTLISFMRREHLALYTYATDALLSWKDQKNELFNKAGLDKQD